MNDNSETIQNWFVFNAEAYSHEGTRYLLRICVPLDESINILVSENFESCIQKTNDAIKERNNLQSYLNQIKNHYLFQRKSLTKDKKAYDYNEYFKMLNQGIQIPSNPTPTPPQQNPPQPNSYNFKQIQSNQNSPNVNQGNTSIDDNQIKQLNLMTKEQLVQFIVGLTNEKNALLAKVNSNSSNLVPKANNIPQPMMNNINYQGQNIPPQPQPFGQMSAMNMNIMSNR